MKVLVALSGGVDSSVAAARVLDAGHEVVGVTLKQWEGPDGSMPTAGCCTVADAEDARRVAAQLDVPYYVLDYTAEFTASVVDHFTAEYAAGRTPNPCVECNRRVRFRALLERAEELGCDMLATGHHARIERDDGRYRLRRGADRAKDQSYVLHMLGQAELAQTMLPVGDLTKGEVRRLARSLGLRTADKPDSQDICFVASGDYRTFLRRRAPESMRPGVLVDTDGTEIGRHDGTANFTIGQRRGLGISALEPRFVVDIRPATATVVVGERGDLAAASCIVTDVTFTSGHPPEGPVDVQVRYRAPARPAGLTAIGDGSWQVDFEQPAEAVAPGQAAVFYADDEVLGGGTIASVR